MTITREDIERSLKEVERNFPPRPPGLFDGGFEALLGMRIIQDSPRLIPKIELREHVPVSAEFRISFNRYLTDTFGYHPPGYVIPKGTVYFLGGMHMAIRRDDYVALMSTLT